MGRVFGKDTLCPDPCFTVKPIEFYNLGLASAPTASSEAEHRMVIGRIYYGLHHESCCRFFRKNPSQQFLNKSGRHSALVISYKSSKNSADALLVGQRLENLKMLRELADYELGALQFANQQIDSIVGMNIALQVGNLLLQALESYSPGEAPDGCICVI